MASPSLTITILEPDPFISTMHLKRNYFSYGHKARSSADILECFAQIYKLRRRVEKFQLRINDSVRKRERERAIMRQFPNRGCKSQQRSKSRGYGYGYGFPVKGEPDWLRTMIRISQLPNQVANQNFPRQNRAYLPVSLFKAETEAEEMMRVIRPPHTEDMSFYTG